MALTCKIYIAAPDVREQLRQLGLTLEALKDVLRHIALTMNSHTADHPSWGPGITTASEAVFSLRSILKLDGWQREEDKGFALTVHPEGLIAINIAKGDEGTGDPEKEVLSVSDKGVCTERAIHQNQLLFGFMQSVEATVTASLSRPTWYLLYSKRDRGIHAEISLPLKMDSSMHLSGWVKRIILPITRIDGEEELTAGFDDGGFEVNVRRRG